MENKIIFENTTISANIGREFCDKITEKVYEINPDFNGTKTEAIKLILQDYFENKTQPEVVEIVKNQIEEVAHPNSIIFDKENLKELKRIAFLANRTKYINENSVEALIMQNINHYRSNGIFVFNNDDLKILEENNL